jgi:hypothetical protein
MSHLPTNLANVSFTPVRNDADCTVYPSSGSSRVHLRGDCIRLVCYTYVPLSQDL